MTAKIRLIAAALSGVTLTIQRAGKPDTVAAAGSDHELNLQPGDKVTLSVQARPERQPAAKAPANPDEVPDKGQGTGEVTERTGATTKRSTATPAT